MKTKVVYVLISDATDIYCEQLLVSLHTLRIHQKDAIVQISVDQDTFDSLQGDRSIIKSYCNDIIVVDVPEEFSKIQRSRFIKTSLRKFIVGDYLYIDTDTIIAKPISEIDNLECEIGAVYDYHRKDYSKDNGLLKINLSLEYDHLVGNPYYNSGVIYVKDTPRTHAFYKHWHQLWLETNSKGSVFDQPPLFQANIDFNNLITKIDDVWNCMISEGGGIKYLKDSKIIHVFFNVFKRADSDLFLFELISKLKKSNDAIGLYENALSNPIPQIEKSDFLKYVKTNYRLRYIQCNPRNFQLWKSTFPENAKCVFYLNWNCNFLYRFLWWFCSWGPVFPFKIYLWLAERK